MAKKCTHPGADGLGGSIFANRGAGSVTNMVRKGGALLSEKSIVEYFIVDLPHSHTMFHYDYSDDCTRLLLSQ